MTTETDLLPLPAENYVDDEGLWETRYGPYSSEQMKDYARANVARAVAPLQAEIEALRAEVAEMREFRNNLANAIGNDQLRRFIEKHGEPVPLTIRMQEAESRAERLAEALRELVDVFSESGMYDEEVFAKARAALGKESKR